MESFLDIMAEGFFESEKDKKPHLMPYEKYLERLVHEAYKRGYVEGRASMVSGSDFDDDSFNDF